MNELQAEPDSMLGNMNWQSRRRGPPLTREQRIELQVVKSRDWAQRNSDFLARLQTPRSSTDFLRMRFGAQRYTGREEVRRARFGTNGIIRGNGEAFYPATCVAAAVANGARYIRFKIPSTFERQVVAALGPLHPTGLDTSDLATTTALKQVSERLIPSLDLDITRRSLFVPVDQSSHPLTLRELYTSLQNNHPIVASLPGHAILLADIFRTPEGQIQFGYVDSWRGNMGTPASERWRVVQGQLLSLEELVRLELVANFENLGTTKGLILRRNPDQQPSLKWTRI